MIYGDFEMVDNENEDIFAFSRKFENQKVLIVANFRSREICWKVPDGLDLQKDKILISNYEVSFSGETLNLRPFEAFACFVK